MEINWTVISYFVIALFALSGFYKGWWREAIISVLLAGMIFLLQNPTVAQGVVTAINGVFSFIWEIMPNFMRTLVNDVSETLFGVSPGDQAFQINAGDPTTWIVALIIIVTIGVFLGRSTLAADTRRLGGTRYRPNFIGSILGGLLGGLNGLIIINLAREYLDGRNLPGGLPTDVAQAGGNIGGSASAFGVRLAQVPSFTVMDSFIPWLLIGLGILFLLTLFRSRVRLQRSDKGYRKIVYEVPYGYQEVK